MLPRVFPYLVATATGIVSGVYIFKPLIDNLNTETVSREKRTPARPIGNVGHSKLTENDMATIGVEEESDHK